MGVPPRSVKIVSFDAEATRLHGDVFAIGAVCLRPKRDASLRLLLDEPYEEEIFEARCPVDRSKLDPFVVSRVLPAIDELRVTHGTALAMRAEFWAWLTARMSKAGDLSLVVVDGGWPVEAGLLSACVSDDPEGREMKGPYPLHEVASLLLAAGMDPLGGYAGMVLSAEELARHREHHPVDDARVSARCALMALEKTAFSDR